MRILNEFSRSEFLRVSEQIHELIFNEEDLTKRGREEIKKLLEQSSFYVAIENNKICGFISRERLKGTYFEIKSWYVIPSCRGTGLAEKLFNKAISDSQNTYICATFKKEVMNKIKLHKFKQIKLTDLPLKVLISYIFSRSWKSILKHLFVKRSYLLKS